MAYPQLLEYIAHQLGAGVPLEQIKRVLREKGWQESILNEAFAAAGVVQTPPEVPVSTQRTAQGELPPISSLFSRAWQRFTTRFWVLVLVSLVQMLCVVSIVVAAGFGGVFGLFIAGSLGNMQGVALAGLAIGIPILVLALVFIQLWGQLAFLHAASSQEKISIGHAFSVSWRQVPALLWVSIISFFTILGGWFAVFIPGIIFTVWFLFFGFVFVTENERGLRALQKSKFYVRDQWWGVAGRLFLLGLVTMLVQVLIPTLVGKIAGDAVMFVVQYLIGLVFSAYAVCFAYILFDDLRNTKAGLFPDYGKKWWMVLFALIGALIIPLLVVLAVFFMKSARLKAQQNYYNYEADAAYEHTLEGLGEERVIDTDASINTSDTTDTVDTAQTDPYDAPAFFDQKLYADLYFLRNSVDMFFAEKGKFPTQLSELIPTYIEAVPIDRKMNVPYSYATDGKNFSICGIRLDDTGFCVSSAAGL